MVMAENVLSRRCCRPSRRCRRACSTRFYAAQSATGRLMARIEHLENKPVVLPSFDGFQHQLRMGARIAAVESPDGRVLPATVGLSECNSLETLRRRKCA